MPRRLPLIAAALALLVAVPLATLAPWHGSIAPAPARPAASPLLARADSQGAPLHAVAPAAVARTVAPPVAPPAFRTRRDGPMRDVTWDPWPRHVLVRGRVTAPVDDLADVRVWVGTCRVGGSLLYSEVMTARADPDGTFVFDVTGLLETAEVVVRIQAEHPRCRSAWVDLPGLFDRTLPRPGTTGDAREVSYADVELALEPWSSWIAGRVELPLGVLPRSVGVAVLELEPLTPQAARADPGARTGATVALLSSAQVAAGGDFELRATPGWRLAVVAAAQGMRPSTRTLDVPTAGRYLVDFALDGGAAISGRLRLDDGPPPASTSLYAMLRDRPDAVISPSWNLGGLRWVDGRLEWSTVRATTDAQGGFELAGLCPQHYVLLAVGMGVENDNQSGLPVGCVAAPASGIELGPFLSRIVLDVGPSFAEARSLRLVAQEEESREIRLGPYVCGESGLVDLRVRPDTVYSVWLDEERLGGFRSAPLGQRSLWRAR